MHDKRRRKNWLATAEFLCFKRKYCSSCPVGTHASSLVKGKFTQKMKISFLSELPL